MKSKALQLEGFWYCQNALGLRSGLDAEFIEGANQFAGNLRCGAGLDDVALHQVDEFAVA